MFVCFDGLLVVVSCFCGCFLVFLSGFNGCVYLDCSLLFVVNLQMLLGSQIIQTANPDLCSKTMPKMVPKFGLESV